MSTVANSAKITRQQVTVNLPKKFNQQHKAQLHTTPNSKQNLVLH
jgi:hypothetical protein